MKLSLKVIALGALVAATAAAAPVDMERRDVTTDRIVSCFVQLFATGKWSSSCKAAVAVDMGLIRGLTINQMSMDFTGSNPYAPTTSSSSIEAKMLSIPGIDLPISSVRQHVILIDNGVQIGHFETPWSAASVKNGVLKTSFADSTLTVFPEAKDAFAKFVGGLSTSASRSLTLKGAVDAKLNLGIFGSLTIPGIGFKVTTSLAGLDNLKDITFKYVVDQEILGDSISMSSIININNPSKLTVKLGDVSLATGSDFGPVGFSTIKGLSLVPGPNTILSETKMYFDKNGTTPFLAALTEKDQPLYMSGYDGASANPVLNTGLRGVSSKVVVLKSMGTFSRLPHENWKIKILPDVSATNRMAEITATFYSPYYGLPVDFVSPAPPESPFENIAQVTGLGMADATQLFSFLDNAKFKLDGKGGQTVTFQVSLNNGDFRHADLEKWTAVVNHAKKTGSVPVALTWFPGVGVNNDGKLHLVDWGSADGIGIGPINIATGPDFEQVLKAIPSA